MTESVVLIDGDRGGEVGTDQDSHGSKMGSSYRTRELFVFVRTSQQLLTITMVTVERQELILLFRVN